MWQIKRSRGLFLSEHQFADNRSVWSYVGEEMLRTAGSDADRSAVQTFIAREDWQKLAKFVPNVSNCPVIEQNANGLVDKLDASWKALAKNVFFGVTLDGIPNAEAHNHRNAGIVSISLQFMWLLESYVLAYDAMLYSFREHARAYDNGTSPNFDQQTLTNSRESWRRLETAAIGWRDPGRIDPGRGTVEIYVPGRDAGVVDDAVQSAVTFTLAHELAHHILGHTSRNSGTRAKDAVQRLLQNLGEASQAFIKTHPKDHERELLCDAMAFQIISGVYISSSASRRDYMSAYRAMLGSCICLLSLAHVGDHWISHDYSDTHPSFQMRWHNLLLMASEAWGDWPRDTTGGHPLDLAHQLRIFVDSAFTNRVEKAMGPSAGLYDASSDAEFQDLLFRVYMQTWDERIGNQYRLDGEYDWPRPPENLVARSKCAGHE